MPEHYTTRTESVTAWCNKCQRHTVHQVSGHRIGSCTEHQAPRFTKAQLKRRAEIERQIQNPPLFH